MINNKYKKYLKIIFVFVLLCFTIFFVCETADARAGGGHSFSRGSSSSGSRGGRGNGIGRLIFELIKLIYHGIIWLCEKCPIIGYPLLVLFWLGIIWIIYQVYLKDWLYETFGIGSPSKTDSTDNYDLYSSTSLEADNEATLYRLKTSDPTFDVDAFSARAKKAFRKIQTAWEKRDINAVQAFIADGTYERFLLQIDILKKEHIIDVMEDLSIINTSILSYESKNNIDSIDIAITAKAKNYRANEKTKKYIEGDKKVTEFTEVWTFIRRTGAKKLTESGLIEGYCPNCGAKIKAGRHVTCEYCNTLLRSGQHDWVLVNITQLEEWHRVPNSRIIGANKYYSFDPGFNIQHIEDRASAIFWRKVSADYLGKIDVLQKIATDSYCDKVKASFIKDKSRTYYDDCAVGSLQVVGIDSASDKKDDFIYVKIVWSGIKRDANKPKNFFTKLFDKKVCNESILVLKRNRGVMTDVSNGLCAAPCPACGAFESDYMENSCGYCGHVMNDGASDWVLNDIYPVDSLEYSSALSAMRKSANKAIEVNNIGFGAHRIKEAKQQPATEENVHNEPMIQKNMQTMAALQSAAVMGAAIANNIQNQQNNNTSEEMSGIAKIQWAIAMMLVDGSVHEKELSIVYDYGNSLGVDRTHINNLINAIKSQQNPAKYVAQRVELKYDETLIRMILRIIVADGKLSSNELNFLKYIGKRMKMDDITLKTFFEDEKRRFYQQN